MTFEEDPNKEKGGITSPPDSLIGEISSISAQAYLNSHSDAEATIVDTKKLMRANTKLGRMVLETAGQLAKRGTSPEDAYLLGVIHGLGLAERRRQEELFETQFGSETYTDLADAIPNELKRRNGHTSEA